MQKASAAILMLTLPLVWKAQGSAQTAPPAPVSLKHYLLTVVLSNSQNQASSQRFVFDVPVRPDHPGTAEMHWRSGPTGEPDSDVRQTLKCIDVHASSTGLAATVAYTMVSVSPEPMPGSTEHVISQFVFEKQIDVPLAVPTEITDPKALKPLADTQGEPARKAAPLKISLTATEL